MTLSKKMKNALVIEENEPLFICPNCGLDMKLIDRASLVCGNGHSFDLSKNGYVNLSPQAHATKYDQSLFEARTEVMRSGFFEPVIEQIVSRLDAQFENRERPLLLDAGCGEGTHLSIIHSRLKGNATGAGIDISKEGIIAAAKNYPGYVWSVADLANCPFQDGKFDAVLNILSPANYAEFGRILCSDGYMMKVVPESKYLVELREIFHDGEKKEDTNFLECFSQYFDEVETEQITYRFSLSESLLASLIRMTPLTWNADEAKIGQAMQAGLHEMTVDLRILSGYKRRH
ncbi:methyltransferase domain-containing protein [Sporosarcina contaminans]|uniref:Methyltransferase domain-containing protein n=1 Tax=Sporosarcina contaminans TaxID=633403 RepID=A0ABW3U0A2_9BACL